jgi:hypothetical protein
MVSEFGRVEKTIYREMVSSVKEVNVKGVKLVRRAFLRWMKAAPGKKVLNQHEALLSLPGRLGEVI